MSIFFIWSQEPHNVYHIYGHVHDDDDDDDDDDCIDNPSRFVAILQTPILPKINLLQFP